MRPQGNPNLLEKRRQQAIAMLLSGEPYRIVAKKLKSSLSSVVRWFQVYRKEGRKGLRSQAQWGRPSLLTEQQKTALKKKLLKGAAEAGYTTDLWTLKRIVRLIKADYGVGYTQVGVWKLLRQDFGWSCQKPERRAVQRNERAIAYWKRETWPRIKKNHRTWGPFGLPGRKRIPAYPKRSENLGSDGLHAGLAPQLSAG
jgi:transposase